MTWGFMFSWNCIARKANRLAGYDYSKPGKYFVTICTQNRECVFGRVVPAPAGVGVGAPADPTKPTDAYVELSSFGKMADEYWRDIPNSFPFIRLHDYVIMPNHIHGILEIPKAGSTGASTPTASAVPTVMARVRHASGTISDAMKWFKSFSTNAFARECRNIGRPFDRRLWQRSFHDSIIRNRESLERIRLYIRNNPAEWGRDRNNPDSRRMNPQIL